MRCCGTAVCGTAVSGTAVCGTAVSGTAVCGTAVCGACGVAVSFHNSPISHFARNAQRVFRDLLDVSRSIHLVYALIVLLHAQTPFFI